jgi:hypothetical protein
MQQRGQDTAAWQLATNSKGAHHVRTSLHSVLDSFGVKQVLASQEGSSWLL